MSRPSAAAAPLDDGVLLEEILIRLPPQPSSLPRASLVCRRWRGLLSDPAFLSRFRKHHHRQKKPPPLLGFFDSEFQRDVPPIFNPAMGKPDRIPPARFSSPWCRDEGWAFVGCRHGLALFISRTRSEAVVWDPLTDHQRHVSFPPGFSKKHRRFVENAAVMCAAAASQDGHVHGDCRFTPFRLALVGGGYDGTHKFACLYDSESGLWGEIVSVETTFAMCIESSNVLVRDVFCWVLPAVGILKFDFQSQSLVVTEKPADAIQGFDDCWSSCVVRTGHGGMALAVLREYPTARIQLYERKSNCHGVVGWELQKTIQLDGLFPQGPTVEGQDEVEMRGCDEDTNAIFLSTLSGDYMIQLESSQLINLFKTQRDHLSSTRTYHPYRNFFITGSGVGSRDGGAEM